MGTPCHRRVPGQHVSRAGGQLAALQGRSFLPSCGLVSCAGARLALLMRWATHILALLCIPGSPAPSPPASPSPDPAHAASRVGGPH